MEAACPTAINYTSLTDKQGDTFNQLGGSGLAGQEDYLGASCIDDTSRLYYTVALAAGQRTITFDDTAAGTDGSFIAIWATEYSNIYASNPINAVSWTAYGDSCAQGAARANPVSVVATSNPNDVVASLIFGGDMTNPTAGAGFSLNWSGSSLTAPSGEEDAVIATPGTVSVPWTIASQGVGIWDVVLSSSPEPEVQLSPTGLGFGTVETGTTSGAMTSTLTNTGGASLTISSISVTGTNAADFTLATGGSNCAAGTVAASATCIISVTFTPSINGSETASVSITDNASGSPHTLPMSGTGFTSSSGGSSSPGCGTPVPQSLLCGATANSYAAPSGWTVVDVEDFEGSVPEVTVGTIGTAYAHTGTHSLYTTASGDGATAELFYNVGAGTDFYMSQWRYYTSSASTLVDHYFFRLFYNTGGLLQQECVLDWQDTYVDYITAGPNTNTMICQNSLGAAGEEATDWTGSLTIFPGQWHQYELWFHPNTTCTGSQVSGSSLPPGDGYFYFYVDGTLSYSKTGVNLTNCNSFVQNAALEAEIAFYGSVTYFYDGSNLSNCYPNGGSNFQTGGVTFSAAPVHQINGTSPCWGSETPFDVAIDDIIIMKK